MNDADRPGRARLAVSLVVFAAVATVITARTVASMNVPGNPGMPRYGLQDFRDAIYYPVVSLLAGRNPYDVPTHLATYPVACKFPLYAPHTLLVHLPFGLLSPARAQLAHLLLNVLLVVPLAWVALRTVGLPASAPAALALGAVLLATHPGELAIFLGQSAVYVGLGVLAALHFARARPWLAAAGLALAATKPTFAAPAALLMLCRGDVRAAVLGGALATAASLAVVPFLVRAAGGVAPFVGSLRDNYASWGHNQFTSVAESVHRIDVYLLAGRLAGRTLTAAEDAAMMLAIFALAAWSVWRLTRAEARALGAREEISGPRREATFSRPLSASLVCAAILTGTYHQTYDGLILVVPALLVARDRWQALTHGAGSPPRWALALAVGVPAINYLSSYGMIQRLGLEGTAWVVVTTANAAAVLAGFVLLAAVSLRWSARRVVVPGAATVARSESGAA